MILKKENATHITINGILYFDVLKRVGTKIWGTFFLKRIIENATINQIITCYAMHKRKIVVFSMNYLPAVFLLKISQV